MSAIHRLAAALLVSVAGGAAAQERLPGLALGSGGTRVAIALTATDGAPPRSGQDLRVAIAFTDTASDRPVAGLAPRAWLRRTPTGGGPSCAGAAWTARATGAISPDDVALDRSFLVAVGRDGATGADRLATIDLSHQLRSANQVGLTPLGARAAALLVHPRSPRAFVALSETGRIASVALPWGGLSVFATGFEAPEALAPLGQDLVVRDGRGAPRLTRLSPEGARRETLAAGPMPVRLVTAGEDTLIAAAGDGSATILGAGDRPVVHLAPGSLGDPVAASDTVLISAAADATLRIRWLDDPHRESRLALPSHADGVFLRDDGRYGLAWSNGRREAVVIDLGRSQVTDTIPLPDGVDEVASSGTAVVLTHATAPMVTVIELASLAAGSPPVTRRIRLPVAVRAPAEPGARLVGGGRGGNAVTVRPGSNVALTLAAGGGLGDQPMSAVTIRGDRPYRIARFDQRLAETRAGHFEGTVRLAAGGPYEVVTTTGPGGTTACAAFAVLGDGPEVPPVPHLRLIASPTDAAVHGTLTLALDDTPPWLATGPVALRVQDLAFGASMRVPATLSADARLTASVTFASEGAYAISLDAGGERIHPVVVRIGP